MGLIDGYTELRTLGQGASGVVILARHDASGQLVAIKSLAPRLVAERTFVERFRAEAQTLRRLRHPNISGIHWYIETESEALLAMEAVDGVPLRKLLENGPTEPEAALAVLQGSLLGLEHAHQAGIVHRDYKPENVIVETTGNSRLIDFGIAVPVGGAAWLAGTPRYMAPEQWERGEATPQTDVYAAAAVCFECLAGVRPFEATTLTGLRTQHVNDPVPVEKVPEALRPLLARGMAKNPAERFASAGAFLAELEVVAAAAYGPDWAERGRRALGRSVAGLALLLPMAGIAAAVAGGAGTALASTDLGGGGGEGGRVGVSAGAGGSGWWSRFFSLPVLALIAAVLLGGAGIGGYLLTRSTASPPKAGIPVATASSSATAAASPTATDTPPPTPTPTDTPTATASVSPSSTATASPHTSAPASPTVTPPVVVVSNASIAGTVVNDVNGNGVADGGEGGVSGATVTLTSATGSTSMTSGSSGAYGFSGLAPGNYTIDYAPPTAFLNTGARPLHVSVAPSQSLGGENFFARHDTSIAGTVTNGDTNSPDPNITVRLSQRGGATVTTTTASDGSYFFGNLAPATYQVTVVAPLNYDITAPAPNPVYTQTVTQGQSISGDDFVLQKGTATVSGKISSSGSASQGGTVTLSDGTTTWTFTATPSTTFYQFTGLAAGTYTVGFTPANPPGTPTCSVSSPSPNPTPAFTLTRGQNFNQDFLQACG